MADKSPKKDGGQRYDWNLIMTDYVTNYDSSLRKIAEKYGIRFTTVKDKAKADSWFATKQEFQKRARTKAATKAATKKADELVGLVTASDYAMKEIVKALEQDPDYFYKHIISDNMSDTEVKIDLLNFKAMKDMMKVIKDIEDVKRSILDLKKPDVAERLAIERERLALEKERIALERERNALRSGNMGAEDDSKYGVVLIPERSNSDE